VSVLVGLASLLAATVASGTQARGAVATLPGRTYYVSAAGSDRASGRTTRTAWRTVARVDRARLRPGDRVLFRAGDVFSGVSLAPRSSGTGRSAIVYGSYGRGRAAITASNGAVYLSHGVSHLVVSGLLLSTGGVGLSSIVKDSPSGPPTTDLLVVGCRLANTGGSALISNQTGDLNWRLVDDVIQHTGDSGLILNGAGSTVRGSVISDVGWNDAIPWNKHGIYVKGAAANIVSNHISGFPVNGISLRSANARVVGNTVTGGPIGVAFFAQSSVAGRSVLSDNTITGAADAAFYYDPHPPAGGAYPAESFALTGNHLDTRAGGVVIDVRGAVHASIEIKGNLIGGPYKFGFMAVAPGTGTYSEGSNRFTGPSLVTWNGDPMSVQAYRTVSGQGTDDVEVTP
jgi:hypothetical protein